MAPKIQELASLLVLANRFLQLDDFKWYWIYDGESESMPHITESIEVLRRANGELISALLSDMNEPDRLKERGVDLC